MTVLVHILLVKKKYRWFYRRKILAKKKSRWKYSVGDRGIWSNYANKIVLNIKNIKIKFNNIYLNIHYKKIKLEQWRSWRRRWWWRLVVPGTKRPKRRRTCITHVWSNVHDHLTELVIICRESLVFFYEMSRVLLQGNKLLRLGAQYWLEAPNGWDTIGRPQVLGRSVGETVHLICIGPLDNHTSIHKSGTKSGWVEGSSPYLSLNWLYYWSPENEKRNHHIQFKKNNNL